MRHNPSKRIPFTFYASSPLKKNTHTILCVIAPKKNLSVLRVIAIKKNEPTIWRLLFLSQISLTILRVITP